MSPPTSRPVSKLADHHLATGAIACLIVEPILSDGGLVVPPDGFLAELHAAVPAPRRADDLRRGQDGPGPAGHAARVRA